MGDMADWALEQMWDPEYDLDDDQDSPQDNFWFPRTVTCLRCGKSGLRWGCLNNRWLPKACKPGIDIDVMRGT